MDDCIFCKIIANEIPSVKVYEDTDFLAFMDINPSSFGHTLVIPKEHYDKLDATPPEVVGSLYQLAQKLGPAIMRGSGAQGYNVTLNNGSAAGQMVFHTHVHLIPRRDNDGLEPWPKKEYADNQLDEFAKRIRAAIKGDI